MKICNLTNVVIRHFVVELQMSVSFLSPVLNFSAFSQWEQYIDGCLNILKDQEQAYGISFAKRKDDPK